MKRLLTSGGLVVAAFAAAPSAAGAADCELGPTIQAFAPFGDSADYYLAPGGDYESLAWTSRGRPSLVPGSNPYALAGGVHSLRLDDGEAVRSPLLCVTRDTPAPPLPRQGGRRPARRRGAPVPQRAVTEASSGSMSPSDHRRWAPSRNVDLKVQDLRLGESGEVTVSFRSQGEWLIDDVFVDPYRR